MRDASTLVPLLVSAAMLLGCGSPATEQSVHTYNMGERAPTGSLIYNVFDTKWITQLGTGVNARVPTSRFFLVRMSVVNSGSTEASPSSLTIFDDSGQSYAELSNGDGVPQWIGYLRRVKPAETLMGYVLFDAPPKHYRLRVSDEMDENKVMIDIPLSFTEESPSELAVPMPVPPVPERK